MPTLFWEEEIENHTDDIMIVGHLPHVSKVTSKFLINDEEKEIIDFQESGLVCLVKNEKGKWSIRWMITPEVLK